MIGGARFWGRGVTAASSRRLTAWRPLLLRRVGKNRPPTAVLLLPGAMVSWSDETSEDSVLNISSSCDGIIKLPATMHDPNFNGTEADVNVLCEHGEPAERFVAFEGMHTGRRFLGCAKKEGINCGVV
ncbi:hypothetical protein CFC21_084675 [Triticum aestivum]|uniref:Zinc finger GRF-type domain-containing protein n=2 Tax=Triticum aestivum TaxID=4565 RepID=A0A3B6NV93_WHEAT|nr:hypothetical protein CFC21_084675 [Triticum aestivum]